VGVGHTTLRQYILLNKMRTTAILILLSQVCVASSLQNVRFKQFGTHIPALPELEVRWNAPPDALPTQIWVYRPLPRRLSPESISFIMNLCSFTEKDRAESNTNGLSFQTPDNSRHLRISFPSGSVHYEALTKYSHTNLVVNVPDEKHALQLVKRILPSLGINFSDIDKRDDSDETRIISFDSKITYFVKPEPITNTLFRAVGFRRAFDGISLIGLGTGGNCEIDFGDHAQITKIDLSWRNAQRVRAYRTLSPAEIIHSLLQGKALQGYLSMNSRAIDWRTAKSVTVNHVWPRYYAGDMEHPSEMLEPFAVLDSVVDTGYGMINVEIDCPIIDENSP